MVLIRKTAPDFKVMACMPDDTFKQVSLSQYRGKYVVLYFYPADFTFVCASETIGFHAALADFESRGAVVLGCSIDTHHVHKAWKNTEKKNGGLGTPINHPILADINKDVARAYDVLIEEGDDAGLALRGVFIIGKDGKVRAEMKNDLPLGRNVEEVLRVLDSVVYTDENGDMVCPMNWKKGKTAMKPTTEGVSEYLTKHT